MEDNKGKRAVILTGLKHCGKSTVGKILAEKLGCPFYDTDSLIEKLAGKTARELYLEGGAELMARKETEACGEAAKYCGETEDGKFGPVISTGGAFSENPEAAGILRRAGVFVYIKADFGCLYARILKSAEKDGAMPAFLRGENPEASFREIYDARAKKYSSMADFSVPTDGESSPEDIAVQILRKLETSGNAG